MADLDTISNDPRPIKAIWYDGGEHGYQVGSSAHKIVAYREEGPHSYVTFFAVMEYGDKIIARVPAHQVTVVY